MIIRKDQLIAGYAAPVIRELLRQMGSVRVGLDLVERVLGCSADDAVRVVSSLQTAGFISTRTDGEGPRVYERTAEGNRLAQASLRPISSTTAHRMLREFLQRIHKVNSNPSFLYTVTAAVVFGSAASDTDVLGDVDVAVRLDRKVADWETHVRLSYERVWRAQRTGKRFRNITEQVFWPAIEIRNFLKSGTRQLSIHEFDELCRLPNVKCRILLGQRCALRKLLPNAEIVS